MQAAVEWRPDWEARRIHAAAREAKDANQTRRLLVIAAAYEERDRITAVTMGAMDRQRLGDWGHRFNAAGPAALIKAGPDFERDHVVRWRCVDLQQLILTGLNIAYHERTIDKLLRRLGFRHISARPRQLGQDLAQIEALKKSSPSMWAGSPRSALPRSEPSSGQSSLTAKDA
jgi:hypothetical protein